MLIDCPACARSYHVSRAEIGDDGREVICPRCNASWFVDGDGTSLPLPANEDLRVAVVSARPAVDASAPRPPRVSWSMARPVAAGISCLALAMGVLGARERIVRIMPRVAALYAGIGLPVNVRGLEIEALLPVRPEPTPNDLTISGAIRNVAHRRVGVPRLTYEVRDAAGAALVTWSEAAPARTLAVGHALPFVSSPHRIPAEARSILVRFEDAEAAPTIRIARALDR